MVCAPVICARTRIWADATLPDSGINPTHPVQMIGHDDKFIFDEADFFANFGRPEPFFLDDFAQRIEMHQAVQHLPKQRFAPAGDDVYEIATSL